MREYLEELFKELKADFLKTFDSEPNYSLGGYDDFDYCLESFGFSCGRLPKNNWDKLLVFQFDFYHKENSEIIKGAMAIKGELLLNRKKLSDFKNTTKYTKFLNRWYDKLKENL